MKILHICTKDTGGAGKAAFRLHHGLKSIDVESKMLVLHHNTSDSDVTALVQNNTIFNRARNSFRNRLIAAELKAYDLSHGFYYTMDKSIYHISNHPLVQEADIIHLHWIAGMVDYAEFFSAMKHKPIVWTLHDANPFTGGCHVPGACTRYTSGCGACPALQSQNLNDLSRRIVERKRKAYQGCKITIVTPSRWLGDCAEKSLLLHEARIKVIPNGVPTSLFIKYNQQHSRNLLNLPQDKMLILFGVGFEAVWKGFTHLKQALELLIKKRDVNTLALVTFGVHQDVSSLLQQKGFPVFQLGRLQAESLLPCVYSAADILVLPSLEDNFPNVMLEAMACGVPIVAYRTGGIPEAVIHYETGLLAERGNVEDLAKKIEWMINHPKERQAMGENARKLVEQEYTSYAQAQRYLAFYERLLGA